MPLTCSVYFRSNVVCVSLVSEYSNKCETKETQTQIIWKEVKPKRNLNNQNLLSMACQSVMICQNYDYFDLVGQKIGSGQCLVTTLSKLP